MVLETAINAQAQALITFSQRDFGKTAEAFGIEFLLPSEATSLSKSKRAV
jgi:hypothetical protein